LNSSILEKLDSGFGSLPRFTQRLTVVEAMPGFGSAVFR
jgi:hypothetical protein